MVTREMCEKVIKRVSFTSWLAAEHGLSLLVGQHGAFGIEDHVENLCISGTDGGLCGGHCQNRSVGVCVNGME